MENFMKGMFTLMSLFITIAILITMAQTMPSLFGFVVFFGGLTMLSEYWSMNNDNDKKKGD